MIKPSVQELQALGQGYTIVPVYKEILSDVRTPISVLKALATAHILVATKHGESLCSSGIVWYYWACLAP